MCILHSNIPNWTRALWSLYHNVLVCMWFYRPNAIMSKLTSYEALFSRYAEPLQLGFIRFPSTFCCWKPDPQCSNTQLIEEKKKSDSSPSTVYFLTNSVNPPILEGNNAYILHTCSNLKDCLTVNLQTSTL